MRTRYKLLLPAMTVLFGCATYSEVMVGPNGDVIHCSVTGQGVIGMATAHNAKGSCVKDMEAIGYLPLDEAGVVGITFETSTLRLVKVEFLGPAYAAGMRPGNTIVEVDHVKVSDQKTANTLLFGRPKTRVAVEWRTSQGSQRGAMIEREPYKVVYQTDVE